MAATLASLWEKKKKVQPNHATNRVDLNITEDSACNSEATARKLQTDASDGLSGHSQATALDSSSMQSLGPGKKRKRAQLSSQQLQLLEKVLGSSHQPSTEEISSAAKKAAVPEQLVQDWLDEQHDTQAKKASVLPQTAKLAVPMQHDLDGSAAFVCAQGSQSLDAHDDALAAANLAQADTKHKKVSRHELPGKAQQASEDVTAAQLAKPSNVASPEQPQSTSKQRLLEQHRAELKQCMQQAQVAKPLADLPLFTDGQLNRPEVRTILILPSSYRLVGGLLVYISCHESCPGCTQQLLLQIILTTSSQQRTWQSL